VDGEMDMITKDQTFKEVIISLDGNSFYGCKFHRCKFQFSGLLPVHLHRCQFDNCTWDFAGPAANTLSFLRLIYNAGASDLIEETFRSIRGERPSGPILTRH
jgi:hypothetical protein